LPFRLTLRCLKAINKTSTTAMKRTPKQTKLVVDTIKLDKSVANKFTKNRLNNGIVKVKPIKYFNFITASILKHKS
jgi:hypothetical protein